MRALVFNKELQYTTEYPVPVPKEGEALIKVTHGGICNTDIEITKGYMGFKGVLGHEFVGVVKECSRSSLEGSRVVGEINLGCGSCMMCMNEMTTHCMRRSVLGIFNKDGVFAEYVTLPIKNLHEIPDSVSDQEAVFVEPLAAAFEILDQVSIDSLHKVCVLGDGKLGILVVQALSTVTDNLVAVGKHTEKLSILDELGIKTKLSSHFSEKGFDLVVDCTGSSGGIRTAVEVVKPRGTVILKTTTAKKSQVDLNQIVINEINLMGSRCGPFPPAIEAITSRQVDLLPLISNEYMIEDGIRAFQQASKKGEMKVLLKML